MGQTKIEWATHSWNIITGCSPVSEGCANCYAKRMAQRLRGRYGYPKDEPFRVIYHKNKLYEPAHWKKPGRIFVCSMGDLFHPDVSFDFVMHILDTIAECPQHKFLVLTKRPDRMKELIDNMIQTENEYGNATWEPDNNIWLGVSVENQQRADERIPILLQIPAKIRFVSIEPMLGPVDLRKWLPEPPEEIPFRLHDDVLQWVILGGETGPRARPMYPDWAKSVRDQCQEAGAPFFFKQWGDLRFPEPTDITNWVDASYDPYDKKGGRELDGRLWEEWPE